LKQAVFSISGAFGVNRLFAFVNRHRPVVLAFHGVTAEIPGHLCNHGGLHLYLPIFERLMTFIASRYHAVPLARVVDWLEGRTTLPERAVVVTFDDGYRNVLTNAAPVLKRLGIPATLFVAADFVRHGEMLWTDRLLSALYLTREPRLMMEHATISMDVSLASDADKVAANRSLLAACKKLPDHERIALLDFIIEKLEVDEARLSAAWPDHAPASPEELRRLPELGVEVGSHTCSHAIVSRMTPEQMANELFESKQFIEDSVGRPCDHFSYPNGGPTDFDATTRRHVIDAGYRSAVTTIKRAVSRGQDCFAIPRCVLTHNRITLPEFAAELSGFPGFLRDVKGRLTGRDANPRSGSGEADAGTSVE
jgi:peptidoglycan/xylan/chitin deacetylase (PgdA/CDA1 family)